VIVRPEWRQSFRLGKANFSGATQFILPRRVKAVLQTETVCYLTRATKVGGNEACHVSRTISEIFDESHSKSKFLSENPVG
jgi:hypothetical protein